MTASISLQFIGLFKLLTWFWFNFGMYHVSRKLSISFTFFNFYGVQVYVVWPNDSLNFLSVSCCLPFYFWFCYFGRSLSVFWLVWIRVHLFCWFSQIITICFIDSLYCFLCFCFAYFSLYLIISCLLLLIGESASFCSRYFRYAVKSLMWVFSIFFMWA